MRILAFAIAALAALPAVAQDFSVDRTKLYVSDPDMCKAIKRQGVEGVGDGLTLSFADGIQAYEFHCDFYDVKVRDNSSMILVEAVCEYPGERYPDLISISPYQENSIEVVSLYDSARQPANEDNPSPGISYFTRCDSLSSLPR